MIGKPQAILFDLDGTLVDSAPDLAIAVDAALAEIGHPAVGADNVRLWIGNGAMQLIRRALSMQIAGELDAALVRKVFDRFSDVYQERVCELSVVYPGVMDALRQLAADGILLACVTNKRARFTLPLLEQLGLAEFFGVIVSGDTVGKIKPDPAPLLHAAGSLKVAPASAVMVGDSINDIAAARAAGMPVVAVSYGYNHGENIGDAGADAIIDRIDELALRWR